MRIIVYAVSVTERNFRDNVLVPYQRPKGTYVSGLRT